MKCLDVSLHTVWPLEPWHLEEDYKLTTFFENKRILSFFANGQITFINLRAVS